MDLRQIEVSFHMNITDQKKSITSCDLMKHSFVISIDDDRYNQFKSVFFRNGLSPLPEKMIGVTDKRNTP